MLHALGTIYLSSGDLSSFDAVSTLLASSDSSTSPRALKKLHALGLVGAGEWEQAEKAWRELAEDDPRDVEVFLSSSRESALTDSTGAEQSFGRATLLLTSARGAARPALPR